MAKVTFGLLLLGILTAVLATSFFDSVFLETFVGAGLFSSFCFVEA